VVSRTSAHGLRWSYCIWRVCEHRELVHHGDVQSKATRWAAVGPRPRWVTFTTSTPFVITSLRIASPKGLRATLAGGHGAHAGDFAQLITLGPAAYEDNEIHSQQGEEAGVGAPRSSWRTVGGHVRIVVGWLGAGRPSAAGEFEESVERVRVARLMPAVAAAGTEGLVDDRIQRSVDEGTSVRSAATLDVPTTLRVGPAAQAALAVNAAMGGIRVGIGGRLGPVGLLA
jgi:hypothetical protein